MTTRTKAAEDYAGREFTITREFAAPRELVFKAWTDPKYLAHWWGPRGFTNPVCEWDVRPGGKIYDVMRAPNGERYPMGGEFREIVTPEKLVFSCGTLDEKGDLLFEFLHTVTFAERNGKTLLTIQSRVLNTTTEANKYIGGFEMGMTSSLEKLAELLEKYECEK
ncbi:MAG: SRPBCC domain-containing protein [Limisphaerales bacterium]